MLNIKVTRGEYTDLPEIYALQKVAFYNVAKFNKNFLIRPLHESLNNFQQHFYKYYYSIAINNGIIIGSARGIEKDNICYIENVIVHPEFQGKGIGKKLVINVESNFSKCIKYQLYTGKNTPGNVSFYEKLYYSIVEEIPATKTEPIFVVMEKVN